MEIKDYNEEEEKKERFSEASLWIVFTILSSLIFIFVVVKNIEEVILKYNGNKITTAYHEKEDSVIVQREDGTYFVIDITGIFPSHREKEIDLYYYGEDEMNATPLSSIWFWIFVECFFGGIAILCFRLARKNLKVTKHSQSIGVS